MSATTQSFRTRTRPQFLQEPIDTRTHLMKSIDEIEASRDKPLLRIVDGPDPWEPGFKWRFQEHENDNVLRCESCQMCMGTSEITVHDGSGGVDFDLCPKCQIVNPYRRHVEDDDVATDGVVNF